MIRKREIQLKPGVKYRGYGYVNSYGEFEFVPEQKGAREGERSLVKQGDGWTVSTTKNSLIIHANIPRGSDRLTLITRWLDITDKILNIFNTYEF